MCDDDSAACATSTSTSNEDSQEMHFGADADFGDAVVEHDVPGDFISVIEEATPDAATLGSVSAGSVRFSP